MMPLPPAPHRTPLRRVSQGSLFVTSRSAAYRDAPHGLGFLEPAMAEFIQETEALQTNVENLKHLSDSVASFNESFAMWTYLMEMNSLTTDWPQQPTDASFDLARRRAGAAEEYALASIRAAEEAQREAIAAANAAAEKTTATEADNETTYMATTNNTTNASAHKSKTLIKKVVKGKKPKLTAKEKKERALEMERIIEALPLEFRGKDPNLRRNTEMTIEGLLDAPGQVSTLHNLIKLPDLSQARVNKCLIALVTKKIVKKDNSTGQVLYHWQGLP
ncbi:hypothetical protein BDZ89DRAFT_1101127 [Hymenopellis radicata]|nr:hypothetical protein BDZ89DRAFT_1101127 [Hymenopellis radicata]